MEGKGGENLQRKKEKQIRVLVLTLLELMFLCQARQVSQTKYFTAGYSSCVPHFHFQLETGFAEVLSPHSCRWELCLCSGNCSMRIMLLYIKYKCYKHVVYV